MRFYLELIGRACVGVILLVGATLMCIALTGCGSSTRVKTLNATLIAVDSARDGFVQYDRQHQSELVEAAPTRDLAAIELAKYRLSRQPIVEAFAQTYKLIATAALLEQEQSLAAAIDAARQLADLLAAFGCTLCGKVSP